MIYFGMDWYFGCDGFNLMKYMVMDKGNKIDRLHISVIFIIIYRNIIFIKYIDHYHYILLSKSEYN